MDFILEICMEIILEGAETAVTEKKFPFWFRVTAAVFLLLFYMGFVGLLFYIGIRNESIIITGIAVFILVIIAAAIVKKYKEIGHRSQ